MDYSYVQGRDGFVWFMGVVEDRKDPSRLGRVRVRCFGYHSDDLNKIRTSDLPWAHVMMPTDTSSMNGLGTTPSFLVEGSWVIGFFRDPEALQEPVVIGSLPGYPSKGPVTGKGFDDPSGKYPLRYNEPDTNRLAVNSSGNPHEVVQSKKDSVTKDVEMNKNGSWSEPATTYNAQYPYNHVFESESGHIKEYDDTAGSERIHEYHKSGTFYEIDPSGNKVTRVVSDNYEIIAGSDHINIKGDANINVTGNYDIKVDSVTVANSDSSLAEIFKGIVDILERVTKASENWVGNMGSPLFYLKEPKDTADLADIVKKLKSLLKDYE